MKWILDRLREPSTFAGLAGIAITFGISMEDYTVVTNAIAAVAGVIAMILPDKEAAP